MANELQNIASSIAIPTSTPKEAVILQGEKPFYAKNIEQINVTIQMPSDTSRRLDSKLLSVSHDFDREYYSLFVVSNDFDISTDSPFRVSCDRILKEYTSDELKSIFLPLSDDSKIDAIKRLPCLFANENRRYGSTDEDQVLSFGYVRDIQLRREGIKVYPHVMCQLSQQRLNEALFDLDLYGTDKYNEFNRMHWSIKKVDLIAELQEKGYPI